MDAYIYTEEDHQPDAETEDHQDVVMNLHPLMEALENTISENHHLVFGILALHLHHPGLGPLKVSNIKYAHML